MEEVEYYICEKKKVKQGEAEYYFCENKKGRQGNDNQQGIERKKEKKEKDQNRKKERGRKEAQKEELEIEDNDFFSLSEVPSRTLQEAAANDQSSRTPPEAATNANQLVVHKVGIGDHTINIKEAKDAEHVEWSAWQLKKQSSGQLHMITRRCFSSHTLRFW